MAARISTHLLAKVASRHEPIDILMSADPIRLVNIALIDDDAPESDAHAETQRQTG